LNLSDITPLILTKNEEPNIQRCLDRLRWAQKVIVLDSLSTDSTQAIAAKFPNVTFLIRPFDDHTSQWNFGIDAAQSPWILSLDCDYVLGDGFEQELAQLPAHPDVDAYFAAFRYLIFGKPLRASLYPPRAALFRHDRCRYVEDGHTQLLQVLGPTATLATSIDHDDRKPLSRWIVSQDNYAKLEALKLLASKPENLRLQDRLRLTGWAAVPATLIYTLLVKRTLLDGWQGWYYTLQRTIAEILLALRLLEKRLAP
jgi:glycosyltransferase involved in cell wall biosynthesis